MLNDIVTTTRVDRDGRQTSTEQELTNEQQAVKNRRLRLEEFKAKEAPTLAEIVQAVRDLMDELGM